MSALLIPPSMLSGVRDATVARSLLSVKPRPMACVGRQLPLSSNFVDGTTQNSLNTRARFLAPSSSSISDIILAYPGFGSDGTFAEVDLPGAITVTAAVEAPAGTFYPVYTTAGSRSLTVTPGRTFAEFLPCPITIPAGAEFFVKRSEERRVGKEGRS